VGEGVVDYDTFISALKVIVLQGTLVMKRAGARRRRIENLDQTARKFLDYVKKFK